MIQRHIFNHSKYLLTQFRAVCVTGPRQSGKTTLSNQLFKGRPYVSFENPAVQHKAEADVAAFMKHYSKGAVLDEVQRVPDVFRQLQGMLDKNKSRGQFILTGSNNFLLQEQLSQSLAGRAGYIELLPLSYGELQGAGLATENILQHIVSGGYPEIWDEKISPASWMSGYVQTYVQRDVRLLRNITNYSAFTRMIQLCSNYAGQVLVRDELAKQVGVDNKTIQAWLGVLESSYLIYFLQPWHNNLNKRIIKAPKLYFYDTGLLCYLLGIKTQQSLLKHPHYGAIFENWVITEIAKNRANAGINGGMFYFRDSSGNEIDLVLEKDGKWIGAEVKATKRPGVSDQQGLRYWSKYMPGNTGILIHGGNKSEFLNDYLSLLSWKQVTEI